MDTTQKTHTFLDQLNTAQRTAVTAPLGVQLVIAGAGSGKKHVLLPHVSHTYLNNMMFHHTLLLL